MPLRLSLLQIDASIDLPEFIAPAKGEREVLAYPKFAPEEPKAAVSKVAVLESKLEQSGQLAWREPGLESQEWLSWARKNGKGKVIERRIPQLEFPAQQDPVLTGSVRRLLTILWAIVVSRALQVSFPLQRTTVSVFADPTEQERKAILRLACQASAVQALAFWDSLELDLQSWLGTLNENERTTFITKLGLRVHWR